MSLATPSCVQKLQAASHGPACVFSESRMREICLSGFDEREQEPEPSQTGLRRRGESQLNYPPGDYSHCACSRLYSPLHVRRGKALDDCG
jgi:hypothetical protein